MKCDDLSTGLIKILELMLTNDDLAKLVYYNSRQPFDEVDLTAQEKEGLILKNFFPYNAGEDISTEKHNEIRVFFHYGKFQSREILGNLLVFQLLVHQDNLLIRKNVNGTYEKRLRSYELVNELVNMFIGVSLEKVGIIHFESYKQVDLGIPEYACFEIICDLTVIG